ncbi:hypothetical protein MAR_028992, partial [Mya arenaria]
LDGRIEANGRSKTWVNTGQECFEKGLFPTLFRHIQSTNFNETGPFWTSVIRMDSLLRVDGCNTLNDTDVLLVRNLSDCRWQSGCDMFGVRKTDTDVIITNK